MAIPLISNVGFTEVSSSGVLNDKAGTAKSKLPIQLFKLSGAISGNLTLNNDSAHKKIILDTNGNNITNSSGSPLTTNSSTTLELKGSGNVQSTLKTFTSSGSGDTTISEADNSTVAVQTDTYEFDSALIDDNRSAGSGTSFGDGTDSVRRPTDSGSTSLLVSGTYFSTGYATLFGGKALTNINRSDFAMSFSHAFLEDGTPISGAIVGPSGPSTFDGVSADQPDTNTTHSVGGETYRFMRWNSALVGVNNGNSGTFAIEMFIDVNTGKAVVAIIGGRGAFNQIKNVDVVGPTAGRRFIFTNNLAISCVLTGTDPFNATVSAGATNQVDRDSTDSSFSLTGTISGNDGSSRPFALKDINDGTGSVNEDAYTGTKSVSAF